MCAPNKRSHLRRAIGQPRPILRRYIGPPSDTEEAYSTNAYLARSIGDDLLVGSFASGSLVRARKITPSPCVAIERCHSQPQYSAFEVDDDKIRRPPEMATFADMPKVRPP